MTLGEQLRTITDKAKPLKDNISKLTPKIEKALKNKAELGYSNAVLTLNVSDKEWNLIVDWAIENKIGVKIESKEEQKYRFIW